MRVLVADSHVSVRRALRRLLDADPLLEPADEVLRARDLMAKAREVQPDLVLLEWELPGMAANPVAQGEPGSLQAMRRLLYALHGLPSHPKVVALSGWPGAQRTALLAGADAVICQGSPPSQLLATLHGLAGLAGLAGQRPMGRDDEAPQRAGIVTPETTMKIRNYRAVQAEEQEPGITLRWLVSEPEETAGIAMKLYELAPDIIGPVHRHTWEDQVFVLRGTGAVVGSEGEIAIREGDVIHIPSMEPHQFVNKGERDLCLLMAIPMPELVTLAGGMSADSI